MTDEQRLIEAHGEITDLRAQLAATTEERDRARLDATNWALAYGKVCVERDGRVEQLAAAEQREQVLRDALWAAAWQHHHDRESAGVGRAEDPPPVRDHDPTVFWQECADSICRRNRAALNTPALSPTTAERCAGMVEDCAKEYDVSPELDNRRRVAERLRALAAAMRD